MTLFSLLKNLLQTSLTFIIEYEPQILGLNQVFWFMIITIHLFWCIQAALEQFSSPELLL